jgi:hypothetical protein
MVDAPETIDTAPGPEGVDVGVDGDDDPHAVEMPRSAAASASLRVA